MNSYWKEALNSRDYGKVFHNFLYKWEAILERTTSVSWTAKEQISAKCWAGLGIWNGEISKAHNPLNSPRPRGAWSLTAGQDRSILSPAESTTKEQRGNLWHGSRKRVRNPKIEKLALLIILPLPVLPVEQKIYPNPGKKAAECGMWYSTWIQATEHKLNKPWVWRQKWVKESN